MILGIGTDIVEVARIEKMLERHPDSFARRVLSDAEVIRLKERSDGSAFCAGRWAVKEAVSKAFGTGIGKDCAMHEVSTENNAEGRPAVVLSGSARETFERMGGKTIHVSISHERSYACAYIIIEA